jgi:hypothetical protein
MDEILGTHRYKRIQGEFLSGRILEPAKPDVVLIRFGWLRRYLTEASP